MTWKSIGMGGYYGPMPGRNPMTKDAGLSVDAMIQKRLRADLDREKTVVTQGEIDDARKWADGMIQWLDPEADQDDNALFE